MNAVCAAISPRGRATHARRLAYAAQRAATLVPRDRARREEGVAAVPG